MSGIWIRATRRCSSQEGARAQAADRGGRWFRWRLRACASCGASSCNAQSMSTVVNSVTCVTKTSSCGAWYAVSIERQHDTGLANGKTASKSVTVRHSAGLCNVAYRLAIYEPYVILAARTSGPEVTKEKWRGKRRAARREAIDNELTIIRVRKLLAAAIVERAASAGRIANGVTCFQLCMYSADTLHPSPEIFNKNDL